MKMQGQLILAIRLVSDAESKIKNFKYNHCWHSCSLNGTFCDCGSQFDQQYATSKDTVNKYEDALIANKKSGEDTKIGVVSTTFSNYDITLKDFRKLMEKQIEELPPTFIFLFNNGYPVSFKQEKQIKLKHIASTDGIVDIKRKFNLTRVGVMSVYGEIFGFMFLDQSLSVVSIRSNIIKDLQDIHSFKSMQNNFFFCDRNGWPINSEQEFLLTGWDLLSDNMIKIKPFKIDDTKVLSSSELELNTAVKRTMNERNGSIITLHEDVNYVDGTSSSFYNTTVNNINHSNTNSHNSEEDQRQHHPIAEDHHQQASSSANSNYYSRHSHSNNSPAVVTTNHHHPHYYNSNPNNSPDVLNNINSLNDSNYKPLNHLINDQTLVKSQSPRHKPILISYVRKEAEQHARNLKAQLTMLGCDVYLDVDEIEVGDDWQDALNEAVNSCEIFIPLVTPNYGLTLWTNRECKFADIKEKFILPINFLRHWPPTCLAIQFATTQFLPWKTKEEFDQDVHVESSRANDITHWDDRFVLRTAKQINELIKKRIEKSTIIDELPIHEHNTTGEEDNTNDEQSNSLENSIEDNIEADISKTKDNDENLVMENVKENGNALVKIESTDVNDGEVDLRAISSALNEEQNTIMKADQVDHQNLPFSTNLASLVSLSAFNNLPPIENEISLNPKVNTNPKFNEKVLKTLTIKSCKRSNCESVKFTKRTFQPPPTSSSTVKGKKLIAISAHPAQRLFVDSLRAKLNSHFNVWSSTDMIPSYKSYDSTSSTTNNYLDSCKDEFDKSDRFSASLNSLNSSVSTSVDTDFEINDHLSSTNLSCQNFTQILSGTPPAKEGDEMQSDTILHRQSSASIDMNTYDQSVTWPKVEIKGLPSSRFDKCFYRNNVTKSIGKSQWYVESPADQNSSSCVLQADEIDRVNIFKEKVNEARLVIILLSEDYCNSRTSKRQSYYIEGRKQILPVYLEDVKNESHWVGKLMDNPYLVQKSDCVSEAEMIEKVCQKIGNIIKIKEKLNCQMIEKKTEELAQCIQKKLAVYSKKKLFIYVLGSTKFDNQSTKELCEKIGRCLAKKPKIILVTGGAHGVADTVALSFYEERKRIKAENRRQSTASNSETPDNKSVVLHCNKAADDGAIDINSLDVIHILPEGQVGDLKYKYHVKEDGTFQPLPYGHTLFLGESIEDRDCTVSRVFPFCILIGGGKSSARIAQDFVYRENIVIPVCNTGGAAAGNFISEEDCGNNICEMPAGVNEDDWVNLNKRDLPICELGNTIFNIIDSLSRYHLSNVRCKLLDTLNKKICGKKKSPYKKINDVFGSPNLLLKC